LFVREGERPRQLQRGYERFREKATVGPALGQTHYLQPNIFGRAPASPVSDDDMMIKCLLAVGPEIQVASAGAKREFDLWACEPGSDFIAPDG
jgi:hypothetical protein